MTTPGYAGRVGSRKRPRFSGMRCFAFRNADAASEPGPGGWQPAREARGRGVLSWTQSERDARFRRMADIFPSWRVAHATRARELPQGYPLVMAHGRGASAWIADYMDAYHVAGVMILHDGEVRLERYALGFGPDQRWASFSMAKSVTSILAGAALDRGDIRDMDDTVGTYVPELQGSSYAVVTVRQLLTMTSGVRWNEDYADPASDVARKDSGACIDGQPHVLSYIRRLPRQWPAGTHWNYNTGEADLLGVVVQRATHNSLASYLSHTIWQPYGMAADAYWIKDRCDGSDTGGSGFSATLSDYARLGQFMLEGCRISGEPAVAEEWRDGATHPQAEIDGEHRARGYFGYGYQWWINADGSYFAVGIFGQMLHVDPARRLVIAQVSSWPRPHSAELNSGRSAFVAAVNRAVDASR